MANTKKIAGISAAVLALAGIGYGITQLNTPAEIQHTAQYKKLNPGGYYNPGQSGDTFVLEGSYTYLSFANLNHITVIGVNATMANGMEFHDCNDVHITGKGGSLVINSHNANPTNVAINIEGKSNRFEVDNIEIDSAQYAIWFKTEPQAHTTDSSYWHSNNQDGLYAHDLKVNFIKQDGFYAGSTDQNADRPLTYKDGKTYWPLPSTVSNVKFARIYARNIQRTCIQISGGSGFCYIDSCDISETGFEWVLSQWAGSLNQGAGSAFGGNCNGTFEVAHNRFTKNFTNNFYSYAAGKLSVHDNFFDSADIVWNVKNPQQNASVLINPLGKPLTLTFYNNNIAHANNNVQLVIYSKIDAASCISGVTQFVNNDNGPFAACSVTPPPVIDTTTAPPVIVQPIDTVKPPPVDTITLPTTITGFLNPSGNTIIFTRANGKSDTVLNVNTVLYNVSSKRYVYVLKGKDKSRKPI